MTSERFTRLIGIVMLRSNKDEPSTPGLSFLDVSNLPVYGDMIPNPDRLKEFIVITTADPAKSPGTRQLRNTQEGAFGETGLLIEKELPS